MSRYTAMKVSLIAAAIIRPAGILTGYLLVASEAGPSYVFSCMFVVLGVSILPELCADPAREVEAEASSPRRPFDWIALARLVCTCLLILWVGDQRDIRAFICSLAPRLWDWRLVACIAIFCATDFYRSFRYAIAFDPAHLYPESDETPKPTAE